MIDRHATTTRMWDAMRAVRVRMLMCLHVLVNAHTRDANVLVVNAHTRDANVRAGTRSRGCILRQTPGTTTSLSDGRTPREGRTQAMATSQSCTRAMQPTVVAVWRGRGERRLSTGRVGCTYRRTTCGALTRCVCVCVCVCVCTHALVMCVPLRVDAFAFNTPAMHHTRAH
jgi:hypothetical protein